MIPPDLLLDPILAHAGPGSTWQAMLVVAGVVLAGLLLAAGVGLLSVEEPGDLVTPLAATAIVASLGLLGHAWLSDLVGWLLPVAVVGLVALLLAALTPLDVRLPAPLPMGAIALAVVASVGLHEPLTIALHPPVEILPLSDDASVRVVSPADGERIPAGTVAVGVVVVDGSIGPGGVPAEQLGEDPEEAGQLLARVREVVDGDPVGRPRELDVDLAEACPLQRPCQRADLEVTLEPGTWQLTVELARGDGTPLAPPVLDRVVVATS